MKGSFIQYFVGALMLAFAAYQFYVQEIWEAAMYASAGLAFLVMGLIKDDALPRFRGALNILSWVLIITAVFLFLFLVRTDG